MNICVMIYSKPNINKKDHSDSVNSEKFGYKHCDTRIFYYSPLIDLLFNQLQWTAITSPFISLQIDNIFLFVSTLDNF